MVTAAPVAMRALDMPPDRDDEQFDDDDGWSDDDDWGDESGCRRRPVPLNFWRGFTLHRMAFSRGTLR